MCHARIQMKGARLFECAITVGSVLVQNRFGPFCVVRFSQPEWLDPSDPRHGPLAELLQSLAQQRIEQTFQAEQQRQEPPKPVVA